MLTHIDKKQITPSMADLFRLVICALLSGNHTINALSIENATITQADIQPETCHKKSIILQERFE
jgi:hypothetical protein